MNRGLKSHPFGFPLFVWANLREGGSEKQVCDTRILPPSSV